MTQAYCVKCRTKGQMKDIGEVSINSKGGTRRSAITGVCVKCGTKVFKITGLKK